MTELTTTKSGQLLNTREAIAYLREKGYPLGRSYIAARAGLLRLGNDCDDLKKLDYVVTMRGRHRHYSTDALDDFLHRWEAIQPKQRKEVEEKGEVEED